jgi:hypothetical protein
VAEELPELIVARFVAMLARGETVYPQRRKLTS